MGFVRLRSMMLRLTAVRWLAVFEAPLGRDADHSPLYFDYERKQDGTTAGSGHPVPLLTELLVRSG